MPFLFQFLFIQWLPIPEDQSRQGLQFAHLNRRIFLLLSTDFAAGSFNILLISTGIMLQYLVLCLILIYTMFKLKDYIIR